MSLCPLMTISKLLLWMVNLMILMRVSTALSESLVSEARGKILEWLKFKEQMPFDGHIEVIFCLIYLDKTWMEDVFCDTSALDRFWC